MSTRRQRRAARSARTAKGTPAGAWWRRPVVYAGAIVVLAVLAVGLVLRSNTSTAPPSGEAAVPCSGTEMLSYHIHAHVEVDIRGARQVVPPNTGIHATCLYWLHTHDDTGLIHIEAPVSAVYTLGQFFTIWGQPLSPEALLGERVAPGEEVRVLVNGQPYTGDPRAVPLEAHEQIVVQLGPPFPAAHEFAFPPGT